MQTSNPYLHIPGLLSAEQITQVISLSKQAAFEDGRATASAAAREVKQNLQMNTQSQQYMMIQQIILTALSGNALFRGCVMPKQVYPFLLSRYQPGMQYGWHVDSPLMGDMLRTDIAITIFLSDPDSYRGGELELQSPMGSKLYKLPQGDAICYPCTQLHRVNEVSEGERFVAVSWIQSLVKNTEQRMLLSDIQAAINSLRTKDLQSAEANLLQQSHSNLLRMWAE